MAMTPMLDQIRVAVAVATIAAFAFVAPAAGFPAGGAAEFATPTPHVATIAATGYGRAIQGVNIRTGGSADYPVVGVLRGGEIVGLAECDPYWCRLADGRGWVARQYLAIGAQPAAIIRYDDAPAPALSAPKFTGAWTVVATPVASDSVLGLAEPLPSFRLLLAQAGTVLEGVADGARIEGTLEPNGREAAVSMTIDGQQMDGRLTIEGADGSLSAIIMRDGAPAYVWRARRTILTQ
jgi:uncharacterized protein YraI